MFSGGFFGGLRRGGYVGGTFHGGIGHVGRKFP